MTDNPFLSRIARAGPGRSGTKAEKLTAKRMGAAGTKLSGAVPNDRGDFKLGEFLVENKTTIGDSLGLKLDWLCKVTQEALQEGKTPMVAIQFVNGDGRPRNAGSSWVMVREQDFKRAT